MSSLIKPSAVWYPEPSSALQLTVVGLNLRGTGRNEFNIFKFASREVKQTFFQIRVFIRTFNWTCEVPFAELQKFHTIICEDRVLQVGRGSKRRAINDTFPSGKEGECDVMILVERKEKMDTFLKSVIANIDYRLYKPLADVLRIADHLTILNQRGNTITRAARRYLLRKRLNKELYRFYGQDLLDFIHILEMGIDVFAASGAPGSLNTCHSYLAAATMAMDKRMQSLAAQEGMPQDEMVLWLDICETDPSLSRLCVAPRNVFELPKHCEDERLTHGLYLSDIAEVRRGAASYAFKSARAHWLRPSMCVSIIGSERTLDVQFESEAELTRFQFIDMLNLLTLQSLTPSEIKLRGKRFRRANPHSSVLVTGKQLSSTMSTYAEKLEALLIDGIEVEEEIFSPQFGRCIAKRLLEYNPQARKLFISVIRDDDEIDETHQEVEKSADSELEKNVGQYDADSAAMADREEVTNDHETSSRDEVDSGGSATTTASSVSHGISMPPNRQTDYQETPKSNGNVQGRMDITNVISSSDLQKLGYESPLASPRSTFHQSLSRVNSVERASSTSRPWGTQGIPLEIETNYIGPLTAPSRDSKDEHDDMALLPMDEQILDLSSQDRFILIDDVSEVRPGKVSAGVDGTEDLPFLSIVASQSVLCLPVPSIELRDNLIFRLRAFIEANRNYALLLSDEPQVFMRRPTPRLNLLNPSVIAAVRDSLQEQANPSIPEEPDVVKDDQDLASAQLGSTASGLLAGLRSRAASLVSPGGHVDDDDVVDHTDLYCESDPFVTPQRVVLRPSDGRPSYRDSSFSVGRTVSGDAGRGSLESAGRSRSKNASSESFKTPVIFSHFVRHKSISALRRSSSRGHSNELSRELSLLLDHSSGK